MEALFKTPVVYTSLPRSRNKIKNTEGRVRRMDERVPAKCRASISFIASLLHPLCNNSIRLIVSKTQSQDNLSTKYRNLTIHCQAIKEGLNVRVMKNSNINAMYKQTKNG